MSAAPPSSTSDNDGRQDELASYIYANLTPFPCCWCPKGSTLQSSIIELSAAFLLRSLVLRRQQGERATVTRAHDAEVPNVERGDLVDVQTLSQGDNARVSAAEGEV